MSENDSERLIRLAELHTLPWLPTRGGKPIGLATWHRWVAKGIRGVRLKTVQVGAARCVTPTALREFFAALGGEQDVGAPSPTVRTPARRQREHARAERLLEAAGI